ncbi:MAG: hypothetical protein K2P58_06060 [Hyphomonadaceae bacterium]|nr:hypothetical protein [Hyphomonadaceae bacterium]
MKPRSNIPIDVMQALQILEEATTPTDLGEAYQVLLDWRRRRPIAIFAMNAFVPGLILISLGIAYVSAPLVDIPASDFWRGLQLGLLIGLIINTIQQLVWRHPAAPSISRRIEAAIDRWRHAVPAMRVIPR